MNIKGYIQIIYICSDSWRTWGSFISDFILDNIGELRFVILPVLLYKMMHNVCEHAEWNFADYEHMTVSKKHKIGYYQIIGSSHVNTLIRQCILWNYVVIWLFKKININMQEMFPEICFKPYDQHSTQMLNYCLHNY